MTEVGSGVLRIKEILEMTKLLKDGSKGDDVKAFQQKLVKLGFDIEADGHFGAKTEAAVKDFQKTFGYTVDGLVGEGTLGLVDKQLGYNWNVKLPEAAELGLRAQGKTAEADVLKAKREAAAKAPAAPIKK